PGMANRRVLTLVPLLSLSLLLGACSGSSSGNSDGNSDKGADAGGGSVAPVSVTGSVGDGPVVGAQIRVVDAAGKVISESTSDEHANYQLELAAGTALPVLITATGGTDLVTGREVDFALVGAALATGPVTAN